MQYRAKEIKNNPNISPKSPLKELFSLLLSLLLIVLVIYIVLGFAVDIIAPRMPLRIENRLGKFYEGMYAKREINQDAETYLQELLNSFNQHIDTKRQFQVFIVENKMFNALALPGGKILVFSGLLKEIKNENELAFVLAHELGHFYNKDHLRALGRNIVFFVISSVFFGQDNTLQDFLGNSLANTEMKFSQAQEQAADMFALNLLYKKYNHVGGAVSFFDFMKEKEKIPKFFYFFSSHPHPKNRIKALNEKIQKNSYPVGECLLLNSSMASFKDKEP